MSIRHITGESRIRVTPVSGAFRRWTGRMSLRLRYASPLDNYAAHIMGGTATWRAGPLPYRQIQ